MLPDVEIVARRLDAARLSIQPSLGATRTDFSRQAIETIPQGDNARLNDVLLRAPGVVDIQTKTSINSPGLTISLYGGRRGPVDTFFTGDFLRTNIGIENPTSRFNARNDESNQARGFAYISGIIDDTTRITLMTGSSYGEFRVPTQGGRSPGLGLTVNGITDFNSSALRQRRREYQQFGIFSLQKHTDTVDLQTSVYTRNTVLHYAPDPLGDLLFNGNAQTARRQITSTGLQTDARWRVNDAHTRRAGFLAQIERTSSRAVNSVLPVDGFGIHTSDQPMSILDKSARTGGFYGVYLQDEWRVAPEVTIDYGVRGDVVDEYTHEAQLSPRVNVVYKPWDSTALHAGYSRYFSPPPSSWSATPPSRRAGNDRPAIRPAERHRQGRAVPLLRRRHPASGCPGPHHRRRRLLQTGAQPDRRGAVQLPDPAHRLQLRPRRRDGDRVLGDLRQRPAVAVRQPHDLARDRA